MPVVTAGPNMAEDEDSYAEVCLSDTDLMLLGGGVVSDQDRGEAGHEDADIQGHNIAGDGDDAGNTQALGARLGRRSLKGRSDHLL